MAAGAVVVVLACFLPVSQHFSLVGLWFTADVHPEEEIVWAERRVESPSGRARSDFLRAVFSQ